MTTGFLAISEPAYAQNDWLRKLVRGNLQGQNTHQKPKYRTRTKQSNVKQRQNQTQASATQVARRSAKPQKIAAPTFYKYKLAPLQLINFANISKGIASDPSLGLSTGASFPAALKMLEGYSLQADRKIAKALIEYYKKHPQFIWVSGFGPNAKATAMIEQMQRADLEGLDSSQYHVDVPDDAFDMSDTASRLRDLIRFEMELSARSLRYISDMQRGRVNPNKLSGYHDLPRPKFSPNDTLTSLATSTDLTPFLKDLGPQNQEYQNLKQELAQIRASSQNDIIVSSTLFLKPKQSDPEFSKLLQIIKRDATPELHEEFGDIIEQAQGREDYDVDLVPLIKAVQKSANLKPDGIIGRRTVTALSPISKAEKLEKIRLAMERLRWLPKKFGARRVFINQPEFQARYYEDNAEKLKMRVVVGKRSNQTNFFYDEIERVDFNPYWGVPQSIIVNEMLPKLLSDSSYLDRAGYEVFNSKGKQVSSTNVNWGKYGSKIPFDVRQLPGRKNALGELKILFPNKHAIYMHDTPSRSFFKRDMRALSHGCVRLHKPREMAAAVLGMSVKEVGRRISKGHSSQRAASKIPVYIAYFTAWPNAQGDIGYFADIYKRDAHLKKALDITTSTRTNDS